MINKLYERLFNVIDIDRSLLNKVISCLDEKAQERALMILAGELVPESVAADFNHLMEDSVGDKYSFHEYNALFRKVKYSYRDCRICWFKTQEDADKFAKDGNTWDKDYECRRDDEHPFEGRYNYSRYAEMDEEDWMKLEPYSE